MGLTRAPRRGRSGAGGTGLLAAALVLAAAGCDDGTSLVVRAAVPPASELEVRVRGPSFERTFLPEDLDEPCDDTAVCNFATSPEVSVDVGQELAFGLRVRRGGELVADGLLRFDLLGGTTGVLTVVEVDPGVPLDYGAMGPPKGMVDFVEGGRRLDVFWELR